MNTKLTKVFFSIFFLQLNCMQRKKNIPMAGSHLNYYWQRRDGEGGDDPAAGEKNVSKIFLKSQIKRLF